ncbi:ATP-binding protein [Gracilibacillus massiliensis]|uniref:ATP-binding protein n=1 Tax=Gracilibacillus massiliensis TaxID=1564956 RepID=UPI00071C68E1|nr:ATP-binding protein [Gracilibacillus massiliensis]
MKLRTKVQLFLSAFMILVIFIINSVVYVLYEDQVSQSEMNRVKADAENIMEAIAQNSEAEIENQRLLQAFLPANGIIRIIDNHDQVIQAVSKEAEFYNWPATYSENETSTLEKNANDIPYVVVTMPLIWEDGSVVTLQLNEALYSMNDTLDTLQIVLFLTAGFMVFPALIAGYFLASYVTKPIQTLTNKMKNNPKDGKWEMLSMNRKGKDEISEMQHSYNAMITRIDENIQKQERFVSDASHELRTPLSVITSYAELLKRRGKDKPEIFDEATEAIISESDRMKHLTDQMLLLAKNQNQENLHFEEVNINSVTRGVIRSLSLAYKRNISFHETIDKEIKICADKMKVHQAIYILVDNACKYSEKEVIVSTADEGSQVSLSVTDRGEGLSEEDQKHIFERFYRADKARSRKAGGAGLGLAICHQIIQAHGGSIIISSQPGNGSRFTILLPK